MISNIFFWWGLVCLSMVAVSSMSQITRTIFVCINILTIVLSLPYELRL